MTPRASDSRPPAPSRAITVSKALSWILRHGAEKEGIRLTSGGWAEMTDILKWRKLASLKVTLEEIKQIVASNDKQRFAMMYKPNMEIPLPENRRDDLPEARLQSGQRTGSSIKEDASQYMIRATQGHSLGNISDEELCVRLHADDPQCPEFVVHGTNNKAWELIQQSGGLKPMSRRMIHFAKGLSTDTSTGPDRDTDQNVAISKDGDDVKHHRNQQQNVISGMRKDASILIWANIKASLAAGVIWYVSANQVYLTVGVDQILNLEWIALVERRKDGEILYGSRPLQ